MAGNINCKARAVIKQVRAWQAFSVYPVSGDRHKPNFEVGPNCMHSQERWRLLH